jgi:hypothetical protein
MLDAGPASGEDSGLPWLAEAGCVSTFLFTPSSGDGDGGESAENWQVLPVIASTNRAAGAFPVSPSVSRVGIPPLLVTSVTPGGGLLQRKWVKVKLIELDLEEIQTLEELPDNDAT